MLKFPHLRVPSVAIPAHCVVISAYTGPIGKYLPRKSLGRITSGQIPPTAILMRIVASGAPIFLRNGVPTFERGETNPTRQARAISLGT